MSLCYQMYLMWASYKPVSSQVPLSGTISLCSAAKLATAGGDDKNKLAPFPLQSFKSLAPCQVGSISFHKNEIRKRKAQVYFLIKKKKN